jgi:nicotinic acid mononucleotide adenylyltransferase
MDNKKTYRGMLSEARGKKKGAIVIGWGRFNPPTVGHEKLIEKVASEASSRGADYRIFPTKSVDAKKNPLSFPQKVKFMRAMFPSHARKISSARNLATIIQAAQALEKEGFTSLVVVAGSDRTREFQTLLNKYNGKDYSFESIDIVSAGERDPDAEGVSGMSASKMRAAASSKDFKSFKTGLPRSFRQAKVMFDTVRKGMNLREEEELLEITKSQAKKLADADAELAAQSLKAKVKGKKTSSPQRSAEKEPLIHPAEDGVVEGPRFNRLLRFGLSPEGTGDIPLVKRAFKNMKKSGPNPIQRDKIFRVTDKVFDYLLNDDILYNRFVVLLHRKELFGEEAMESLDDEFALELNETMGTSVLPDTHNNPSQLNYVAQFSNPMMAKAFIDAMTNAKLGAVTWVSPDGIEIQFRVYKSSVGQESGGVQVGNQRRPIHTNQMSAGSDVQLVGIVAKFGGKLNKFEGDVREGIEYGPSDELVEGLQKKAEKANIPYDIIAEIYARGLYDWEESKKTGRSTPNQWAFARVNSFISAGKTISAGDSDLWEEYLDRIPNSNLDIAFEGSIIEEEFIQEFGSLLDDLFEEEEDIK